jgi:hypothetical protein
MTLLSRLWHGTDPKREAALGKLVGPYTRPYTGKTKKLYVARACSKRGTWDKENEFTLQVPLHMTGEELEARVRTEILARNGGDLADTAGWAHIAAR